MDKETNSRLLLRASEAAHALGISKSMVVYKLAAGAELPANRLGGSVRIPIEPLRRFIADRPPQHPPSSVAFSSDENVNSHVGRVWRIHPLPFSFY